MKMLTDHANSVDLPADEQHQLLDWALARGDLGLVGVLVKRPDLDPGVDARIGELSDYHIKSDWLRRPGRTKDQIDAALRGEKRQTVLAALVETEDLPDWVYEVCTERITGIKALTALVCGPAPERYRAEGARKLARSNSELAWSARSNIERACAQSVAVRRELLGGSHRHDLVSSALRTASLVELDDAMRRNIVEVLLAEPLREARRDVRRFRSGAKPMRYSGPAYSITALIKESHRILAAIGADQKMRAEVAGLLRAVDAAAGDTAVLGSNFQGSPLLPTGSVTQAATEILESGSFASDAVDALIDAMSDEARCASAVAELKELRVRAGGPDVVRHVGMLAMTANPSTAVISAALEVEPDLWHTALSVADSGDIDTARVLLERRPIEGLDRAVFEHFDDDDTLVRYWLTNNRPSAFDCCRVMGDGTRLPSGEDIDLLPGALVGFTPSYGDVSVLLTAISRRCFERWGSDAEAWRMIEQLGQGFHGTLGELFSVIDLTLER